MNDKQNVKAALADLASLRKRLNTYEISNRFCAKGKWKVVNQCGSAVANGLSKRDAIRVRDQWNALADAERNVPKIPKRPMFLDSAINDHD